MLLLAFIIIIYDLELKFDYQRVLLGFPDTITSVSKMRHVGPRRACSLGEMRALLGVDELHHIMSSLVFREYVPGALDELEQVGGRIDVLGGVVDGNRPASISSLMLVFVLRNHRSVSCK